MAETAWPKEFTEGVLQGLLAPFPEDEIDWIPQTISRDKSKAMAAAYIDARAVMRRLDQVVGPGNWSFDFDLLQPQGEMVKGRLTVYGVTKCDIGEYHSVRENDGMEKGKAAVSDALKRAAVHFGIGRFLYYLEPKWAPINEFKRFTQPIKLTHQEVAEACRIIGYKGEETFQTRVRPAVQAETPDPEIHDFQCSECGKDVPIESARWSQRNLNGRVLCGPCRAPIVEAMKAAKEEPKPKADGNFCVDCGAGVFKNVASASIQGLGFIRCMPCQEEAKKRKEVPA